MSNPAAPDVPDQPRRTSRPADLPDGPNPFGPDAPNEPAQQPRPAEAPDSPPPRPPSTPLDDDAFAPDEA